MRIRSARRVRMGVVALAVAPAFALAACSADQGDLQNKIKNGLNGPLNSESQQFGLAHAESVSCPSNVQLKSGYMFDCTITGTDSSGKTGQTFTFHGVIEKGNNIGFISLERAGGATPGTPSTPNTTTT